LTFSPWSLRSPVFLYMNDNEIENLVQRLIDADKIQEAATLLEAWWEDDYCTTAAAKGDPNYSILDFAADVVRENLSDDELAAVLALLN
jgi:hypothetical protein